MKNNKLKLKLMRLLGISTFLCSLATVPLTAKVNALPEIQIGQLDTNIIENEDVSTVAGSNCRQVNQDNLPVMTEPTGIVIAQLQKNQQVTLANEGFNGWVPIEAPISGYIQAEFLTNCDDSGYSTVLSSEIVSTVNGTNCRQVLSPNVPIRKEPKGEIIGQLQQNQQVMIANEGYDGWVPVEKPISGFVTSPNLGQCMP